MSSDDFFTCRGFMDLSGYGNACEAVVGTNVWYVMSLLGCRSKGRRPFTALLG